MIILLMGESGAGKTTAMRNLDPQATMYVDADGKGLSWRGWRTKYCAANKNYSYPPLLDKILLYRNIIKLKYSELFYYPIVFCHSLPASRRSQIVAPDLGDAV
jgi:uridine kinase